MAHQVPEFETKDVLGKTQHYNGSVGLTSALIPAVAADKISNVLVRNPASNLVTSILYIAFDGQTTYLSLKRGEFVVWSPRNNQSNSPILQVRVLGSAATVNYEMVIDYEPV